MNNSYLEIVELEDGQFALKRIDGDDSALVTVNFSDEVKMMLGENQPAIVKAMIGAGVHAANAIGQREAEEAAARSEELSAGNQTLH